MEGSQKDALGGGGVGTYGCKGGAHEIQRVGRLRGLRKGLAVPSRV